MIVVVAVFAIRTATYLHSIVVKLYVSEYYPTAIRATAVGCGLGFAKFGAIGAIFVSEDLAVADGLKVFSCISAISFLTGFLVPVDTTYKEMTNEIVRTNRQHDSINKGERSKVYVLFNSEKK